MLSNDPPDVRRALVVATGTGVTADNPAIHHLLRNGWRVHLLACDGLDRKAEAKLQARGVEATDLAAVEVPADFLVGELYGPGLAERSDRVRHAVAVLHRRSGFRLVEFPGRGGLGFRAVQAKRAGLAFAEVTLAVRLDGTSQFDRERQERWPSSFAEVECDFLERYAVENGDATCLPDDAIAEFVRRNGWSIRPDAVRSAEGYPSPPVKHVPMDGPAPLVTVGIAHYNLGRYLPDTLATLAAQTYPNLEVIAIDDGSTDPASVAAFEAARERFPAYQFLRQSNAGIGATRNRCLELARGEFFIPVDADNLSRPEMIATFVTAMRRNPDLSAMTCYFLAFDTDAPDLQPRTFLHALRPAGGPHALAGIRNVYGDANAIFRTAALRAVGGYETDRGTSCEDWEAFVKLVHVGHRVGVVPDHLFYYRFRPGGFSRTTNWFANHQRVLRQFARAGAIPPTETLAVWTALLGFHQRLDQLTHATVPLRHRVVDGVCAALGVPLKWVRRALLAKRSG